MAGAIGIQVDDDYDLFVNGVQVAWNHDGYATGIAAEGSTAVALIFNGQGGSFCKQLWLLTQLSFIVTTTHFRSLAP